VLFVRGSTAQQNTVPQTARQALLEMFFGKTAGTLVEHPDFLKAITDKVKPAVATTNPDKLRPPDSGFGYSCRKRSDGKKAMRSLLKAEGYLRDDVKIKLRNLFRPFRVRMSPATVFIFRLCPVRIRADENHSARIRRPSLTTDRRSSESPDNF